MKKPFCIFSLLIVFLINSSYGQQIVRCDSSSFRWLLQKDTLCFVVKLPGTVHTTSNPGVIQIDEQVIQSLIIDKKKYIDNGGDNSPLKVLIRYAYAETGYMSKQFGEKLDLQMVQAPLSDGVSVLIWWFKMPKRVSKEVSAQVFACVVAGEYILGLSSPQFTTQTFDQIRNKLMDTISTMKVVARPESACE